MGVSKVAQHAHEDRQGRQALLTVDDVRIGLLRVLD